MAGPTQSLTAWILGKRPPAESFQTLTLFSVEHGSSLALQRISKKSTSATLDLFDEAELMLETAGAGTAAFVKETRIRTRLTEIGKSYENLRLASGFAQLVARNPIGEESRSLVYELLRQAFTAFAYSTRPDVVYLKSLYRFCRDEGYPLKQAWAPSLATSDRTALAAILNQPVAEQTADPKLVARLHRGLEDYLRRETEILLD